MNRNIFDSYFYTSHPAYHLIPHFPAMTPSHHLHHHHVVQTPSSQTFYSYCPVELSTEHLISFMSLLHSKTFPGSPFHFNKVWSCHRQQVPTYSLPATLSYSWHKFYPPHSTLAQQASLLFFKLAKILPLQGFCLQESGHKVCQQLFSEFLLKS